MVITTLLPRANVWMAHGFGLQLVQLQTRLKHLLRHQVADLRLSIGLNSNRMVAVLCLCNHDTLDLWDLLQ